MTLTEAVQVFDRVEPPDPAWLTMDGEAVGTPYCCGIPVVMKSVDGRPRIYCLRCSRTIEHLTKQWIVGTWGDRGIKFGTWDVAESAVFARPKRDRTWPVDEIPMLAGVVNRPAEFRQVARRANAAGLAGFAVEDVEIGLDLDQPLNQEIEARIRITYRKARV